MNDHLAFGENQAPPSEIFKEQDEALLAATNYLYQRWHVCETLLGKYQADFDKPPSGANRFLTVYQPQAAADFAWEEFRNYKQHYDARPPAPWTKAMGLAALGEWYVPYTLEDDELRDGVEFFYHMIGYVQTHHDMVPHTIDGGEVWPAYKYSRDILTNMRIVMLLPQERHRLASDWVHNFPLFSTGMMLVGSHLEPEDYNITVVGHQDGADPKGQEHATRFKELIAARDFKLRSPYLQEISGIFDKALQEQGQPVTFR